MRFKLSTSFIEVNNTNNRVYSYFYFPLTVSSFKFSSQILSNSPFSLIPTLEKDSGFCSLSSFLLRTNHQLPVCISSHPHALPAPLELWKWLPLSSFFLSPLFSFSDGCFTPFKKAEPNCQLIPGFTLNHESWIREWMALHQVSLL